MNPSNNTISMQEERYFPFMESEGIDRRHAVLEISVTGDETGYCGEVFDTRTAQTLWVGSVVRQENEALQRADEVLEQMEKVCGFGSISLRI